MSIPTPVLLHIFSYMKHKSLCKLISKNLSEYGNDPNEKQLPISLILSSLELMEEFKDILMLKMIINESWVNSSIILVAVRHNNLLALFWLETHILQAENHADMKKIVWTGNIPVMSFAARNGNLEMLEWLQKHQCPLDLKTFSKAARGCHVHVLYWLQVSYGWNASDRTCEAIVSTGRSDILQWALEKGCPWDARCAYTIARHGHTDMFHWILNSDRESFPIDMGSLCSGAAFGGHLELLQFAREKECSWDERTCKCAVRTGKLEILQWARENGCPWDARTCEAAARYGHLQILQWAREKGCPWDEFTCEAAARYGHLQILQWAREEGCPWDARTCEAAAEAGFFEILQWAQNNGCPGNENEDADEDGYENGG